MQTHFEKELASLKQELLTMASYTEAAVRQAIEALLTRDDALALKVKENDKIIDQHELQIDDLAIHLLAKAPLATDLRLIMVTTKICQNLERVGDEASKIAKRARELIQDAPLKQVDQLSNMANQALGLLRASLDAFVTQDAEAARAIIPRDKEIDELNRSIYREIAAQMMSHPETITRGLSLIVVAKSLERVADHAKNIAEEVVYLREATDIRHVGRQAA